MASGIASLAKFISPGRILLEYKRRKILSKLKGEGIKIGLGCNIQRTAIGNNVFLGGNVTCIDGAIGDHSVIKSGVHIIKTQMGKFCSIGDDVKIVLGSHPMDMVSTHFTFYAHNKAIKTFSDGMYMTGDEYENVVIGNDVYIGVETLIPGGVTIGDGAVIAARSVVTKDIPPYAVVGGVPAKIIKYRFDEKTIDKLLQIKWWDKEEEWLKKNFKSFHSIEAFMDLVGKDNARDAI